MALRHHYTVTVSGADAASPDSAADDSTGGRFHLFAEAEARFSELGAASEAAGRSLVSESYWRRQYSGEGGSEQRIALDDRGLEPCDDLCGGA